jgi:heme exporter protein CcmD
MDHAPFIWSSYITSGLILLWTALAPLLKQRSALRNIRLLEKRTAQSGEAHHDANT